MVKISIYQESKKKGPGEELMRCIAREPAFNLSHYALITRFMIAIELESILLK